VHAQLLSPYLPSHTKLWSTLQLRGQIHSPCFYSTFICTLWCTLYSVQRPNSWTKSRQMAFTIFPPPLQLCLEIFISSKSRNLLPIYTVKLLYTAKKKGGRYLKGIVQPFGRGVERILLLNWRPGKFLKIF
jgi:hypothetical protein